MRFTAQYAASIGLAVALIQISSVAPVQAAPGDLDPSLGAAGKVTRDFFGNRDEARGVAITPNGKIVVAGFARSGTDQGPDSLLEDFALERYDGDGTLDASFGIGGDAFTDFGGSQHRANDVLIQPNGKIVAAGGPAPGSTSTCATSRSLDTTPTACRIRVSARGERRSPTS
jgi:uncharacterized delta-60 repeat protein